MNPVITAIDHRRREMRISQRELADRAETTQSHISDILTGRTSPSLRVLDKLCAALDLRLLVADSGGEMVRVALMHPATVEVAANQRRLAGALQDMAGVLVEMAKVMESTGGDQ